MSWGTFLKNDGKHDREEYSAANPDFAEHAKPKHRPKDWDSLKPVSKHKQREPYQRVHFDPPETKPVFSPLNLERFEMSPKHLNTPHPKRQVHHFQPSHFDDEEFE